MNDSRNILCEGMFDWLRSIKKADFYHATDIHGINDIVNEDSFRFSYAHKENPLFSKVGDTQFEYYLSLSDRRLSGFLKNRFRFGGTDAHAVITLKNSIANDFVGRTVDFFKGDTTSSKSDILLTQIRSEDEYRLLSNSMKMKGASKYIKQIEIIALDGTDKKTISRQLRTIDRKHKIIVYDTLTNFYKGKGGVSVEEYLKDTPSYSMTMNFRKNYYKNTAGEMDVVLGEINNFLGRGKVGKKKLPKGVSLFDISAYVNDHTIYGRKTPNIKKFGEYLIDYNKSQTSPLSVFDFLSLRTEERL